MANLTYYYGTMNCGKTTILLQRAYNYEERGMHVLVWKPLIDVKGGDTLVSRLNICRKVDRLLSKDDDLLKLVNSSKPKVNAILIDESQFLTPLQVDQLLKLAALKDIPIECYGIRTDFQTNGFPGSERLLCLADCLHYLETLCKCGKNATMVARYKNEFLTVTGEQIAIDGEDKVSYVSYCPKCYFEEVEKSRQN